MCTVSYLPLADRGFLLTANRDEAPDRNAVALHKKKSRENTLIYPADTAAGGTWFCISDSGRAVCLLNGAFAPYTHGTQYTDSRGAAVIASFEYQKPGTFSASYDFSQTAPFTLLWIQHGELYEILWDGERIHHHNHDAGIPGFWSSVTLYPEDVRLQRRQLFEAWLRASEGNYDQKRIIDFHRYGGPEDPVNGFVMNRGNLVKTLSITSALKEDGHFSLKHIDLEREIHCRESLALKRSHVA